MRLAIERKDLAGGGEIKDILAGHAKAIDGALEKFRGELADERKFREELERKLNSAHVGGGFQDNPSRSRDHDCKALRDFIRSGETKAMEVGTDPAGGYTVLPHFSSELTRRLYEMSPMRRLARVVPISSDVFEEVEDLNETDAAWVGETASRDDTDTPDVGLLRIEAKEIYAQPKATQKIIDDSNFDIAAWLAGKVGDKFARMEGDAFINGDGLAKPRGIADYPTAATADATRPWGTLEHVLSGANGDFAASNPADKLIDLQASLKSGYRANAKWLMSRAAAAKIRKFKEATTNAYIWQPGLAAGQPDMLLGHPVELCEDLPALATGSLSLFFGDFSKGYTIVDRIGVRLLVDPYTNKPYVRFYSTKRVGGQVTNFEAIKAMKFSS